MRIHAQFLYPSLYWWIFGGLFLGVSSLHPYVGVFAILGLVFYLRGVFVVSGIHGVVVGSVIVGTAKAAGGLAWIWDTYPLVWLGLEPGSVQLALIGVYWFFDALSIGISLIVCGVIIKFLIQKSESFLLLFPPVFVCSEIIGSFTSSIYSLGPGSSLNINFSFGYVGYAASYLPGLLPVAVFGGVYALSFLIATIATLVYLFFFMYRRGDWVCVGVLGTIILVLICSAHFLIQSREKDSIDEDVIAIETVFSPELLTSVGGYQTKMTETVTAVQTALQYDPAIIILPEDSRFVGAFQSPFDALSHIVTNKDRGNEVLLIDSGRLKNEQGETVLRAHMLDTRGGTVHQVDKQYLVPQGEYVPHLIAALLTVLNFDELLDRMQENQSYRPGIMGGQENLPTGLPRVLFCFESAVPFGAKQLVNRSGHPLIIHPVSHGWFHDSHILRYQLDRMVRAQALWNDVAIIQVGNMAETVLYLPDGSIRRGEELHTDVYWKLYRFK